MKKMQIGRHSTTVFGVFVGLSLALAGLSVASAEPVKESPSKIPHIVKLAVSKATDAAAASRIGSAASSDGIVRISAEGDIELTFHAMGQVGAAEEADLEALGAILMFTISKPPILDFPAVGMIQAWIPYDQVEAAAELDWVVAVTPPGYGATDTHPINPIESEGVPLHFADLAHAAGITGKGVNVGAISDGVTNLADAQAANELPAVTVLSVGSGDEGTAMLEIIHDMAPDAALFFDATGGGTAGHLAAVAGLVAAGVHVIAEDIAFDSEPAFQQGVLAANAEATTLAGVPVHSSSGNRGADHTARMAAVGTGGGPDGVAFGGAPPGCTFDPNNVVAIAPGGDTTFDITLAGGMTGGTASFTLQWSEPRVIFPTAGQGGFTDLDLIVMDAALTTCLAESITGQTDGVGDTIEQISIPVAANTTTNAKIIVNVFGTSSAVAVPMLDLRWRDSSTITEIDATTRAGSLNPDSNYAGSAYAVGAVNAGSGNLEGFSSAGPVDLVTTTQCPPAGAPGPCPATAQGGPPPLQFQGVSFLGADGVTVSGAGGFGVPAGGVPPGTFFGTSAAAPHTAACDALVREVLGATADPADVLERLAQTAIDFGDPGEDPTNGAGLLDCQAAVFEVDMRITKTDDPDPVHAGDTLTYQLTATNLGPDDAMEVVVTDTLPAEVTYIADTGGCDTSGLPDLLCELGTLGAFASTAFEIQVAVPSDLVVDDPDGTTVITNTAAVDAVGFDPDTLDNSVEESTFVDSSADLAVTKTCKPDGDAVVGEDGTCEIFVDNNGPSDADSVVVVDSLVSQGTFDLLEASIDVAGGVCTPSSQNDVDQTVEITCDGFDLPAGDRATITIRVTADEPLDVNDVVTVTSATPDPDLSNNQDEGAISFLGEADLGVTKSDSPDPVVAGTGLVYTVEVTNFGPSTAVNVLVSDILPAGVTIDSVAATGGASCNAGVPGDPAQPTVCAFDSMADGATESMTVEVTVLPQTTGLLHNDVSVSSDTADSNNANDLASETTTVEGSADLSIVKSDAPDPVVAGAELSYTLEVTNNGPSTASMVVVEDVLPGEVSFLGTTILEGGGTCDENVPNQVRCEVGDLDPGEMFVVVIDVLVDAGVPDGTVILNTASVSSATGDPDPLNNEAVEDTTVAAEADLWIDKTGEFVASNPSKTIFYTITVHNDAGCSVDDPLICGDGGPSNALNVVVVDDLPLTPKKARVGLVSEFCVYDQPAHIVTCTTPVLPAGASVEHLIVMQVKGKAEGLLNQVSLTSDTSDPDLGNNADEFLMNIKGGSGKPGGPN